MSIRSKFSGQVRSLLRKTGRDIVYTHDTHNPASYRQKLLAAKGVNVVLDVGANTGQTGMALRGSGYSGKIVSFEPQSRPFRELSERAKTYQDWQVRQHALGETSGEISINVSGTDWSSSFLPMADRHREIVPESAYVGTENVRIARLDDVFPECVGSADRVFLKVDTQGYELSVLRGGIAALRNIALVQLELCLVTLYDGQPKYHQVMQFMDEAGFDLVGIYPDFIEDKSMHYLVADGLFANRTVQNTTPRAVVAS